MYSGPATQPDPASMAPGALLAGRYRLEREIGRGGFGTVYEAQNLSDQTRVALKVLSPRVLEMAGGAERFRREAELARRLSHPNIVRVLDSGEDERGALYIAFELLQGRSLQDEIQRSGALPPRRAAAICLELLGALEHAHALGVIHRDIKPANIHLVGDGPEAPCKILDFGIAKSTNPGTRPGLTQDGTAIGTPAYMAPEQIEGTALGPATDVFSLGVVLAEMLTGRPLFDEHASAIQIISARLSRGLPIPPAVLRSPLGSVIATATEPALARRFPDARAARAAVEAALPWLSTASLATGADPVGPTAMGAPTALAPVALSAPPPQHPGFVATSPSPQYAPALPPPAPPRKASSAAPVVAVALVLLLAMVGGAVGYVALRSGSRADRAEKGDSASKSKKRRQREKAAEEEEETADEDDADEGLRPPPRDPPPVRPPPVTPPPPAPTATPSGPLGRVRACSGVPLVPPGVRTKLVAAGFSVSGKLLYCAGDMVNFQCKGPRGDGFTVEGGGSAALIKLGSASEAETFANTQAKSASSPTTYAHDGGRVLMVTMQPADADRLLAKVCR